MIQRTERDEIVVYANYYAFVFALIVLSLINNVLLWLPWMVPSGRQVIVIYEYAISIFLLADFLFHLLRVRPRGRYFFGYYGWMALLGSFPFPGLRVLRLLQLILFGRKLRRIDLESVGHTIVTKRAQSTLLFFVLVAIIIFEIGGVLILTVEARAADANITTASDALWWAYVTVTTVGYGDRFPVTNAGRFVAAFLMAIGIGLFGVISGFLADWFRAPRSGNRAASSPADAADQDPRTQLNSLRQLLDQYEQNHQDNVSALRNRLDQLERSLE